MVQQEYINNRQPSVVFNSLIPITYDAITVEYPDNVTEDYEFRVGGIGGTIVRIITVIYEDSCKDVLISVVSV